MKMYPKTFSGLPAVQVESELKDFISLIKERQVTSYLEIGTARGDTFFEIVKAMPKGSRAVAVDLPMSAWGLKDSNNYLDAAAKELSKEYDVKIIYGSSRERKIIDQVKNLAPFDAVFIDGDHTLEGVTYDWKNYGRMGKIVAFHDIVDDMKRNKRGETIDVPLFWASTKTEFEHVEFIGEESKMGIGVLFR